MDTNTYNNEIASLISGENTYEKIDKQTISKEINKFNNAFKKLIKNGDEKWSIVIEYSS